MSERNVLALRDFVDGKRNDIVDAATSGKRRR